MNYEQFKQQNKNFSDEYYEYAIHITDFGAIYLYQLDKVNKPTNYKNTNLYLNTFRLDGANIDSLIETLIEIKNNKI